MELHFKNDVVKKFEFEGVNTGEAWGTLDAYVSFLEQSVYRKSLLEREKHLWWRFETPEEIKNAQAMHDSMEKDMELCWERGEQGIGDGIFR